MSAAYGGKVMKGLVGFVVMFMALSAWAEAWLPDVKYLIKPDFPNELRYAGSDGEVESCGQG